MRHQNKFNHLGRKKAHRDALLANMTISLIMHKRIFTTLAKAKALRPYAEHLVNVAQRGIRKDAELAKARKDLEYLQKFLAGVRAKLSNEKFTAHAPAQVIENERKKEFDALSKIESLEAKIAQLSK